RMVLAALAPNLPLRVRVGSEALAPIATTAPLPVLEHAVAAAKLEALVARGERSGWDPSLRHEVIDLARAHRLSSPFTALLVLESDADRPLLEAAQARHGVSPSRPLPPPVPARSPASSTASVTKAAHVARAP